MKRLILVTVLTIFGMGAYQVQAQEIDLGIKLGANFSTINDASGLKNKTGLQAGAFLKVGFGKYAIQPEVLYSQQGAKSFDLDYVNVPVMFKYYIVGNILNLQAGPQFGFLTNDSLGDQIKAKSFDFSGAAGAGIDLPLGFRVDARYHFGMTDVFKEASGKNGYFSVALGYSFF